MKPNILIADDSLTIQKVIKITLANEDYQLEECLDAVNLLETTKSLLPSVVLLDFNLSDNKTGYDLAREIKSLNQSIKVMMLYGTFDNIDNSLLSQVGVDAHIVKPFDGTKFITTCRRLVGDLDFEASVLGDDIQDEAESFAANWVVDQPEAIVSEGPADLEEKPTVERNIESSLKDWGMEIPEIIDFNKSPSTKTDLPPIIEKEENVLPVEVDLEYPTSTPSTKFEETTSSSFDINDWKVDVPVLESLEEEAITHDDLWAVDETLESSNDFDIPTLEPHGLKEVEDTPVDFPVDVMADIIQNDKLDSNLMIEDLVERLVQKKIDEVIESAIEKIAWDVIPDLAENLIKKELKKISDSIL